MNRILITLLAVVAFAMGARGQTLGSVVTDANGNVVAPSGFFGSNRLAIVQAIPWSMINGVGPVASRPAANATNANWFWFDTDASALAVSTGSNWLTISTSGVGYVAEAPNNSTAYVRRGAAWVANAAAEVSDSTAAGRALLTAASAAAQRAALELGAAASAAIGTTAGTVAAGDDARFLTGPQVTDLTDGGNATNHYHATDRDRANHTGTQGRATISDFAHQSTHAPGGADALPWATIHGKGTTGERPSAAAGNIGYLYYNTTTSSLQRSTGSAWEDLVVAGGSFDEDGSYTLTGSWTFEGPVAFDGTNTMGVIVAQEVRSLAPISVGSGGTGGTNATQAQVNLLLVPGTHVQEWDEDLDAVAALTGSGFVARTGDGAFALRTLSVGAGLGISNAAGASGNPEITLALSSAINAGVPNGSGSQLNWSRMVDVPAGFADGVDNVGAFTWDIDTEGNTADATVTPLVTNLVTDGYTKFLRAYVVAAGPTNRGAWTISSVVGNVGGTGSGGTNQLSEFATDGSMRAYWERSGASAVLKVKGVANENIHWLAQATIHQTTNAPPAGGGGGQIFLVNEDFEGTGTPGGWTTSGSPDFDYTTSPIQGSQSFYAATTSDYSYTTYTASGEVWFRVRARVNSLAANFDALTIRDSSGASIIYRVNVRTTGSVRVYQGAQFAASSSGLITEGSNFYLWGRYVPGTASDGIGEVYISATSTRPASPTATVTVGDATALPARIRLLGGPIVFDELRVSETEIDPD